MECEGFVTFPYLRNKRKCVCPASECTASAVEADLCGRMTLSALSSATAICFVPALWNTPSGATAAHSAQIQQAPVSTVQDMPNKAVLLLCEQLTDQAWEEAQGVNDLVLGIDDFAIKKALTYNTGIHKLKGETILDLLPGRKVDDLRAYASRHPTFRMLSPKRRVASHRP
jgi:hypothetical protein